MPRITSHAAVSLSAIVSACAMFAAAPAAAQDSGGEKINQLIVYGDDPCPKSSSADEITVCARKDEGERYRIPEPLRGVENPANRAWTDRVLAYETVGKTGTLSCSPVGPGGYTGCAQKLIHNAYAERETGPDVQFGELIAAERQKRLSTIDEDARATQARVEAAEQQYEAQKGSLAAPDAADATREPAPASGSGN